MNVDKDNFNPYFYLDRRLIEALHDDNMEKYLEIVNIKYEEERIKSEEELVIEQIKLQEEIKLEQFKKEKYIKIQEDLYFANNKIEIEKRIRTRLEKEYKISLIRNIIDNITNLENKLLNAKKN